MKYTKQCPICGSSKLKILQRHTFQTELDNNPEKLPDSITNKQERIWIYNLLVNDNSKIHKVESTECEECSIIFNNPRFEPKDISLKYETINNLGFDQKRHKAPVNPDILDKRRIRVFDLIASQKHLIPSESAMSILDYGGAEGYLLSPFADNGWETNLIDFIKYDSADIRINYCGKDLTELAADHKFDVILFLHTLEHVLRPVEILKKLKAHLKPNGLIYIEVPLGAWLEYEFLQEPVTHMNFFSEESLVNVVDMAGLATVHLNTQWQYVTRSTTLCINLIASNSQDNPPPIFVPLKTEQQKRKLEYFFRGGLSSNAKYYSWLILNSYLKQIIKKSG